jgi:hypothetical protein
VSTVLVASCDNVTPTHDGFEGAPCSGHLRYRWGMIEAACDTCGGRCGIAVASWVAVEDDPA